MKFTLARPSRPRNPLVAPALFRQAGRHRGKAAALRRQERRLLALELRHAAERCAATVRTRPDPHSP